MVGVRLSAPETSQVRVLSVCPTIRGVLRLAVTTAEMGRAGERLKINDKIKYKTIKSNDYNIVMPAYYYNFENDR